MSSSTMLPKNWDYNSQQMLLSLNGVRLGQYRGCCRTPSGSAKRTPDAPDDAREVLKWAFYTRIIARLPSF